MSTTITPEEIQGMDLYQSTAPKIKYISIAALTLLTWDLILTFPQEVKLWNTRWTLAKVLFFVNRYFALATTILMTFLTFDVTPTDAMCSVNAFFAIIALLLVANIQMILQHRIYALYAYDKRIVVPVSFLFIAIFSTMMVMAVVVYLYEKDHEAQIFGACCLLGSMEWLYLFWVPMMGLELVLVVLAGHKSLQHYFQVPDKTWSGARLMRTFARDSVLYFLCNFLIYLFSTLLGKFGPSVYYQLGAITISVVPPVSANRLLINMYNFAHDEQPTQWTMVSEAKASLQFVKDTSRVHHEDMELTFVRTKGSEQVDASSFE
ncbi:hypothetical protein C8R48DRAFT_317815 [Suillus tomentosus]|nr:hypothetical protein C8R48DRAFT_317815 [Suillus tomentosus]